MSGERKNSKIGPSRVGVLRLIAVIIGVFGILVCLSSPRFGKPRRGQLAVLTDNRNNAKQVVIGLKMYADDNGGSFPQSLEALMPKYCASKAVLLNDVPDGKAKVPWQYFPGHNDSEEPPVIVIRSSPNAQGDWVAGYSDGSARIIFKPDTEPRK